MVRGAREDEGRTDPLEKDIGIECGVCVGFPKIGGKLCCQADQAIYQKEGVLEPDRLISF